MRAKWSDTIRFMRVTRLKTKHAQRWTNHEIFKLLLVRWLPKKKTHNKFYLVKLYIERVAPYSAHNEPALMTTRGAGLAERRSVHTPDAFNR